MTELDKVSLFYEKRPDITISMEMYFNQKDQLYFDGYDNGKLVEQAWGDSDYEYTYTIEPGDVNKFYQVFNLQAGDKPGLLRTLKERFSVNEAYTLFGKFMDENEINYRAFKWM